MTDKQCGIYKNTGCLYKMKGQTNPGECYGYAPPTNADRIRAMTDEELHKFHLYFQASVIDYAKTFCDLCEDKDACDDCVLWWIKHAADQPQGLDYRNEQEDKPHE